MAEVFSVVGWKDSGKTTLVAALVAEISQRGLKVSTIKHAHHEFSIDQEGTDSFKHRLAGASEVALVSSKRWALMHEIRFSGEEPSLNTMLSKLAPCDLVIVEGYKKSTYPKIECLRQEGSDEEPLWKDDKMVLALAVNEMDANCGRPQFDKSNVQEIADFILQRTGLGM